MTDAVAPGRKRPGGQPKSKDQKRIAMSLRLSPALHTRLVAMANEHGRSITQQAHRALMECSWPGNIRQLENAIEHAVAMSGSSQEISAAMLPFDIRNSDKSMVMRTVTIPDAGISLTSVVSQLERDLILQSLEKTGGNKRQAALLLNMSRTTLIDKIHRIKASRDGVLA